MQLLNPARVGSVLVVLASGMASGCNPPNLAGPEIGTPKVSDVFQGVQCDAVRPQTEPDLMAWDSGSRANLSRLRREGVVAVRYAQNGCNVELEVLSNCIGPGADKAYRYSAYSASQSKVARNAQELFAELPIGAARLTGKLKGNRALRADYSLVGTAALPPGKRYTLADLSGECSKATHVVSVVYVGGFAMVAGDARALEASATVFGMGAGASGGAETEHLDSEGEASACDQAKKDGIESALCAVPLRIGLMALAAVEPPAHPPIAVTDAPRPVAPATPAVIAPPPAATQALPTSPADDRPARVTDIIAADRDERKVRREPRAIQVLVTELQGFASLLPSIRADTPGREKLMRRLAETYVELESAAHLQISSGDAANQARAKTLETAARQAAIKSYTDLKDQYPKWCENRNSQNPALSTQCMDEVIYFLAYEYERASEIDQASKLYLEILQRWPTSSFVAKAYFALGEMCLDEAKQDPSKWELAGQYFTGALMYPALGTLAPDAYFRLAQTHVARGYPAPAGLMFQRFVVGYPASRLVPLVPDWVKAY